MEKNIFEQASRKKLRFNLNGVKSTEQLWDISIGDLDGLYGELTNKKKMEKGKSLLAKKTNEETALDLQITIVKHVVMVKLAEELTLKNLAVNAAKKQHLLTILEAKQNESLLELSEAELQSMISSL